MNALTKRFVSLPLSFSLHLSPHLSLFLFSLSLSFSLSLLLIMFKQKLGKWFFFSKIENILFSFLFLELTSMNGTAYDMNNMMSDMQVSQALSNFDDPSSLLTYLVRIRSCLRSSFYSFFRSYSSDFTLASFHDFETFVLSSNLFLIFNHIFI